MGRRTSRPIEAVGDVPAPRAQVFAFLEALPNHWALAGRWIKVVSLNGSADEAPDGGVVRIHGPLGLRRTARTRVLSGEPPERISGSAELSGGTTATVSWTLAEASEGTQVRLAAQVDAVRLGDRLLLAVGGRAWMRRHFAEVLRVLAAQFAQPERR